MEYDDFQKEAITAYRGYHLVLAPPGCGKTDILSRRIEKAHELGVDYREMLCLTFTNRASKGMQERVSRNTGEPVPTDLFIGNIHRFCAQFLFENSIIPQNTAIIDDFDFDNIIRDLATIMVDKVWGEQVSPHGIVNLQHAIWQKCHGVAEGVMLHGETLGDVRRAFEVLEEESGYDAMGVYEHIEELWVKVDEALLSESVRLIRLARRYEEYKEMNDMLDFDDLLVMTYDTAQRVKDYRRYNWIQIDEVQDLSPAQLAIVDLFTGDDPTVVYLGDEQQAIFSFIGAKMETLDMLKQRCKGNIHRLYKNYRSPSYLLDVVNAYAVQQLNIDPSLLPSTDNQVECDKGDLYIMQASSVNEEYKQVVQQAIGYSKKEKGRIAVIVPYNSHADRVSEAFLEAKVPHFKISGTDLFSTPTIQVLFAHLSIAQNEGGFTSWAKLLYHTQIINRYPDARNFMREMRKAGMLPTDFIRYEESSYMQHFVEAYDTRELVIFDTETTGLNVMEDEIIQIAAVKVRGNQIVEGSQFNCFLEITKEIPPVLKGNKVNPMVEQYAQHPHEPRSKGLKRFLDYSEGCVLVGHNVEYDYHILKYNLQRDCPEVRLEERFPEYYDTLKYIRLVEPRLRHYNLESLLVQLKIEGCNSHMADDDIMATKGLLDYCREHSDERLMRQQQFWKNPPLVNVAKKIKRRYSECYQHTHDRLYELQKEGEIPLLVAELQTIYEMMRNAKLVVPCEKWHYVIDYLNEDVINPIAYDSLKDQLAHYNGDLLTCREADLCGSKSMKEQFFVSTVHKAKGLEFESVIIVEANDDKYPHHRSTTVEAKQEDARKFYVALSRAKKRLCILCTQNPTPFMNCIKNLFYYYKQENGHWQLESAPYQPEGNTVESLCHNGAKMRQLGKVDRAIENFREALKYDPQCREAACQLADIYLSKGEENKAIDILSRVQKSVDEVESPMAFSLNATPEPTKVVSKISSRQGLNPTVNYEINPCFAQRELYPLITLSRRETRINLPRQQRSKVRGYEDMWFYQYLKQHNLLGVQFSNNCHVAVPFSEWVLEPTIVLFSLDIGLLIDVEIDAPYDGVYRYATHQEERNRDAQRDQWMADNGWIVVRFSERQVHLQTRECMLLLQDIIQSAHHGYVTRMSALTGEPRWNATQAMRWEQSLYREHYLGIAAFPQYDYSVKVLSKDDSIAEQLTFDEVSHTYTPLLAKNSYSNYTSVTTLISQFFPFDTENYLLNKARKENRPLEEVREEFELMVADASNRGTELHADIEHFLKGEQVENDSVEYRYFQQFYKDKIVPGMEFVDAEKMVFLPEWNVAGTIDALFRRKRDGAYVMVDWKRSKHLIIDNGRVKKYGLSRGLSILGHLDASSYYQYELQQSFYKYILAQRYGIEVEAMMLCVLYPEYERYYTIRLENYREREVKAILQTLNRNQ